MAGRRAHLRLTIVMADSASTIARARGGQEVAAERVDLTDGEWGIRGGGASGRRRRQRELAGGPCRHVAGLCLAPCLFTQFLKGFDKVRRRFLWAGNQQLHGVK
jgi:hypothetical protein